MSVAELLERLQPHRPLEIGDRSYVPRPDGGAERLARLAATAATTGPIAVAGPVGVGKSTELARAADLLQGGALACLVRLDRLLDMGRVTSEEVQHLLAHGLERTLRGGLLREFGRAFLAGLAAEASLPSRPASDRLLEAVRRVRSADGQGKVIFLLDGLEKCTPAAAESIVQALLAIADEAGLVLTVPPALVTGPAAFSVLQSFRLHLVRPLPPEQALPFLTAVLRARAEASLPDGLIDLVPRACELSGGLPRTFLQLLQDALLEASLDRRESVHPGDLDAAAEAQGESLGRLLADGDWAQMRGHITGGLEMATERYVRLISHGLLLEYPKGSPQRLAIHPLLPSP